MVRQDRIGMAKIIVNGSDQRREYDLGPINTVGRHPDNTLQILDRIVSKEHAQIIRQPDGRFLFRDLGSLNGSFLRGARISEQILGDGDEITLGSTTLTFQERSAADSLLQKVTIAPSATEALIRQKIQAPPPSREFVPEKEIFDVEVLRRDYEKLRLAHELGRVDRARGQPRRAAREDHHEGVRADPRRSRRDSAHGERRPHAEDRQDARRKERADRAVEVDPQRGRAAQGVGAVVGRDHGQPLLGRALDHHAGHPLDDDRAAHPPRRAARHHAHGLDDRDQRVRREGSADLRRHRQPGRGRDPQLAPGARRSSTRPRRARSSSACCRRTWSTRWSQGKLQLEKGGALSEITMLFSDIRGFTSMSESRAPQEIVRMLNEYFELMVDVIFKYEGTLDKFVGDEIIALFGAPVAMPNAELKAVQCALDMLQGAVRVQPHARVRRAERDQDRHRHQHRHRRHRRDRQLARAAVHGDRRRGQHHVAPVQRRAARRRSSCPTPPSARCSRRSRRSRCRPCA